MSSIRNSIVNEEFDQDFGILGSGLTNANNDLKLTIEALETERGFLLEIINDLLEAEENGFLEDAVTKAKEAINELGFDE
jgi:hypothetical protein